MSRGALLRLRGGAGRGWGGDAGVSCPRRAESRGLAGTARDQAGTQAASRLGLQPRASLQPGRLRPFQEGGVGRAVVGPRADRVGRRPLAAAGGRWVGAVPSAHAGRPDSSQPGPGMAGAGELSCRPYQMFPFMDPAPSQNHPATAWRASSEQSTTSRMGRAGTKRIQHFWLPSCSRPRVGTR